MTEPVVSSPEQTEKVPAAILAEALEKQERIQKRLLLHNRIRTGILCIALIVLLCAIPTLFRIGAMVQDAQSLLLDVRSTLDSLDLKGTLESVDALLAQTTDLVGEGTTFLADSSMELTDMIVEAQSALKNLSSVNIEALNASVETLHRITSAMSRFLRLG